MNTANLNTLIQRYEDNFEWINNAEHDEIFKWRAVRCFQDVWFSEEVEDMPSDRDNERFLPQVFPCAAHTWQH